MANEIVNYPDVSWPEVVNATLGYKNGITEDHLSTSVQEKLNRESGGGDTKPAGGWGTNDIANGAITTDKLAGTAVTAAKIASGAVTEDKIGSGAVTEAKIADGAITEEKVASGVIPGWYYYASMGSYNTDAENVPNGSYVLIGTTQIILYRKAAGNLSQICAWPTGGGGNVDNVVIVPIENNQAQLTPYIIYNAGNNVMFYLYDQVTHALARLHKRPATASDETATFIWEDTDNRQFVLYSLPAVASTGISKSYVAFDQGGGGGGSTTLPQLGGGYATASGGSTVAQSVTITGFVRTTGNGPTVKFTSEITAKAATLNVNDGTDDTGAAAIWYCGSTLKPGTIRSGALVKFVFDGTHYCVESIDERPVIQLVPNNGVVSISGTYQDLIAKLKGAAVPQIICLSPNASAQNMEILELRHVWSNDTTSEIKLAGRLGGIEYYVVLSQSGSSGSEVMSGPLESANITPDVIMQNSLQPTIAIHNNELHDCGTVTRIYISSWPAGGDWGLEFSSSSPATELVWAGNHPTWPDGMTSFVPETGKHYELNVHNGKALIGVWPV